MSFVQLPNYKRIFVLVAHNVGKSKVCSFLCLVYYVK
nr:MAG TPA: hypothetical protein [Caudoviricetes sp.]